MVASPAGTALDEPNGGETPSGATSVMKACVMIPPVRTGEKRSVRRLLAISGFQQP